MDLTFLGISEVVGFFVWFFTRYVACFWHHEARESRKQIPEASEVWCRPPERWVTWNRLASAS